MPMVADNAQLDAALRASGLAPIIEFTQLDGVADHASIEQLARVEDAGRRAWCNALGDWNLPGLGHYAYVTDGEEAFPSLLDRDFTVIQTDLPDALFEAVQSTSMPRTSAVVPEPGQQAGTSRFGTPRLSIIASSAQRRWSSSFNPSRQVIRARWSRSLTRGAVLREGPAVEELSYTLDRTRGART